VWQRHRYDGDGKIDFPLDPGCTSLSDDSEDSDTCARDPRGSGCPKCGNGIDDDGDGLIDYQPNPALSDPGCLSRADDSEDDDCTPMPGAPGVPVVDITAAGRANGVTHGHSVFQPMTCGMGDDPRGPRAGLSLSAGPCGEPDDCYHLHRWARLRHREPAHLPHGVRDRGLCTPRSMHEQRDRGGRLQQLERTGLPAARYL
jgi:hypothetical protein